MGNKIRILGFAGSLRRQSFNKSILTKARELIPKNVELEIFDLEGIPLFNQDLESDLPLRVKEFKNAIKMADAILISTPEYNYSIPGVLKNAIDWASRPFGENSFKGKPVAIMGASPGNLGTARAQYHLRQCLGSLDMRPLNLPEVMVPKVHEKINSSGTLTDANTRHIIEAQLMEFVVWIQKMITSAV